MTKNLYAIVPCKPTDPLQAWSGESVIIDFSDWSSGRWVSKVYPDTPLPGAPPALPEVIQLPFISLAEARRRWPKESVEFKAFCDAVAGSTLRQFTTDSPLDLRTHRHARVKFHPSSPDHPPGHQFSVLASPSTSVPQYLSGILSRQLFLKNWAALADAGDMNQGVRFLFKYLPALILLDWLENGINVRSGAPDNHILLKRDLTPYLTRTNMESFFTASHPREVRLRALEVIGSLQELALDSPEPTPPRKR